MLMAGAEAQAGAFGGGKVQPAQSGELNLPFAEAAVG
jgi:hypothetical protein